MKLRCERDVLADALAVAGRAVSSRGGALPVLAGVRTQLSGDNLELTGSDLDLTISVRVNVAGEQDGVAVIPARLVADIVRALEPGRVDVVVDDDHCRIEAGRSQFAIRVLPIEEFPRLPEPPTGGVTVPAADLAGALRQVITAASTDDARPILTGVLMIAEGDGLRLVATDSYRLAVRDLPGAAVLTEGQHVLVPSKALGELSRVVSSGESVTLRLGERDAGFEVGPIRIITRLIEGEFPNYRSLIPQSYPNRLTVGREPFLEALRRVRLMAREAAPVRLTMTPDSLELAAITQDVGQAHETMDGKYEGSELTVAFNPEYLLNGIEVCPGDEVVIESLDASKPAVIRATESANFLYLLMPVRVS